MATSSYGFVLTFIKWELRRINRQLRCVIEPQRGFFNALKLVVSSRP